MKIIIWLSGFCIGIGLTFIVRGFLTYLNGH